MAASTRYEEAAQRALLDHDGGRCHRRRRWGASDEETIWAAAAVLRRWVEPRRAAALYTDWKNVYVRAPRRRRNRRRAWCHGRFGRMCRAGDSDYSGEFAQAKGRVERNHGTHQDRLVKKLRRLAIAAEAGQRVSRDDVSAAAQRAVRAGAGVVRRLSSRMPSERGPWTGCFDSRRRAGVSNDWVVRYHNRLLQLERQSGYARAQHGVRLRSAAGALEIRYREQVMRWTEIVPGAASRSRAVPAIAAAPLGARPRYRPISISSVEEDTTTCERADPGGGSMTRPVDPAGAMDAQNAPTAACKTRQPRFAQRPQGITQGDISKRVNAGDISNGLLRSSA